MKGINAIKAVTAAGLVVLGGTAVAQEPVVLASVSEAVLVNQGDMYMPAEEGMTLSTGDQVMVLQSGKAQIQYADGCQQQLGENQVMQIADMSTCPQLASNGNVAGLGLATTTASMGAASTSVGTGAGASFGGGASALVGTVAVVGVVAVGQVAGDGDNGKNPDPPPISP